MIYDFLSLRSMFLLSISFLPISSSTSSRHKRQGRVFELVNMIVNRLKREYAGGCKKEMTKSADEDKHRRRSKQIMTISD
jgi:hypothetical protein